MRVSLIITTACSPPCRTVSPITSLSGTAHQPATAKFEVGDRWRRQINGGHVHSDYLNNISLGICLVGDFNRDQPTRAQLDACEELIRYLRDRCGTTERGTIPVKPHREINPPRWPTDARATISLIRVPQF